MATIDAAVDRPNVPPDGATVRVSLTIQPGMQAETVERHVALCIDTSGSMAGEKIERVREGILWVFGYLEDDDHVSVVSFDDEAEVVLPTTRWGEIEREDAEEAIEGMVAAGGTDIMGGLEKAHGTLQGLPTGEGIGRRILLLSDGRDNPSPEEFADLARRIRQEDGISIPAAGIGEFYDEDIIRAIGTASEGEWIHLSEAADIEDFFGRKVEGLSTVVAPRPHLDLALAEGVEVGEVFLRKPQVQSANYERTADGNVVRIYLPDLLEFEPQEVVLELGTPPCEAGTETGLADVTLRTRSEVVETTVEVTCTDDADALSVENEDVGIRHTETMVRKAVGDGDIDRAQTIIDGADEVPEEELSGMETVVERAKKGDLEEQYLSTRIERDG